MERPQIFFGEKGPIVRCGPLLSQLRDAGNFDAIDNSEARFLRQLCEFIKPERAAPVGNGDCRRADLGQAADDGFGLAVGCVE